MMTRWYTGENSAASDRPGPNLKQRVAVIDSSQRETPCARNYAGEGQAARTEAGRNSW